MPIPLWTPGRLNALLSHIDSHKGENSVYLNNRREALSIVSRLISEQYPSPPVSSAQVSRKLFKLWEREHEDEYENHRDLFRLGRTTLNPCCSEADLKREEEGQSSLRNQERESQTPPKKDPKVEISATSTYKDQEDVSFQRESSGSTSSTNPDPEVTSGAQETYVQTLRKSLVASKKRGSKTPVVSPFIVQRPSTPESAHSPQSVDLISDTQASTPIRRETEIQQEPDNACHKRLRLGRTGFSGRYEKIVSFLQNDPNQFLPSHEHLENRKRETWRSIRDVGLRFLETAGISDGKVLELYGCHSSQPFFDICKRVYNVHTREELLTRSASLQIQSPLTMTDFIRALTAAAITEWVFEGKYNPLPGELSQPSKAATMYENIIAELDPELHRQVLRKRNHDYIEKEADLDKYLPDLTLRFVHAVLPFLQHNTGATSLGPRLQAAGKDQIPQWHNALSKAFKKALELHAQVSLLDQKEYMFQYPRNGDEFDRNSMVIESDLPKQNQGGKVHVMLFPALVRTTQPRDRNEEGEREAGPQKSYVFKAIVILQ